MAVIPSLRVNGVNVLIESTAFRASDGSAAAPSISFSNFSGTGWSAASGALYGSVGGTREFGIFADQLQVRSGATLTWGSGAVGGGSDVSVSRDGADTLALRRSTNAQRLNIGQGDTALAAGRLAMGRDAAAAFAPGAGYGMLRWETGTNAGSLKLVAYSGASTTGVTVIDNVGSGNA